MNWEGGEKMVFQMPKKATDKLPDAPKKARKRKDEQIVIREESTKRTIKAETPKVFKDRRLDKLVPLIVGVITRLLGSAGMMRYRKDFTEKVREIMEEENGKKKSSA